MVLVVKGLNEGIKFCCDDDTRMALELFWERLPPSVSHFKMLQLLEATATRLPIGCIAGGAVISPSDKMLMWHVAARVMTVADRMAHSWLTGIPDVNSFLN